VREQILDTAFRHFIHFGYSKTTLSGIAEELGKQKSAIYYYFKNKEDIFNSIVEVEAMNLFEELKKILRSKENEVTILKLYIATRIHAMYNVASKYKLLKQELFVLLPQIELARSNFHEKEVDMLAEILNNGMSKGVIRKADAQLMAKVIVNTLKGLEIPMFVKNEFKADASEIDELALMFLNGITVK
jgi:AcrR family transcriptional regulator